MKRKKLSRKVHNKKLLIGAVAIFVAGFAVFTTIGYSYLIAMQAIISACVQKELVKEVIDTVFILPITLTAVYVGLVITVFYYVKPWRHK